MVPGLHYRQVVLLALLALLASTALAWQHVSGPELASIVDQDGLALVALVQPQEPNSKLLEAQWHAAASATQRPLVSIDCSAEDAPEVCSGATARTAVKLLQRGAAGPPATYDGLLKASAISKFLARHERPVVSELTAETLDAFQTTDSIVFVAFLPAAAQEPPSDPDETAAAAAATHRALFEDAARKYRSDFSFGAVSDPVLAAAALHEDGGDAGSARAFVVCRRHGDGHVAKFVIPDDAGAAAAALDAFIRDAGKPSVAELTPLNHQGYLDRGWPIVYLFACTEPQRESLRQSLAKLAGTYRDSLTVVVADPAEFPGLGEKLGLAPHAAHEASSSAASCGPSGALHQLSKDRIYPYPSGRPIDPRSIQQWGLDVYQGRVKPWVPPGATTTPSVDDGPTRVATRRISIASISGLKINIAGRGHDEL